MNVLVIGAAGMIGRKLVERLARDGAVAGAKVGSVVLHDVVPPQADASLPFKAATVASDLSAPGEAEKLFKRFVEKIEEWSPRVQTGQFGADMQLSLVNEGPVTFWLQASPKSKS